MEIVLKWADKKGLKRYADQLLKTHPELNKKYPTPRLKDKTFLVDFQDIEERGGAGLHKDLCLNGFERQAYAGLCVASGIEYLTFKFDFQPVLNQFTNKQKCVFEWRMNGWTQQYIAKEMGISRKNVVKHIILIRHKIRRWWKNE